MKTLSRKDTRVLGYFSVGTTMVCFALNACFGWSFGWMELVLACYGMLGVALIAEGSDVAFAGANRALYRILCLGMGLPPTIAMLSRWLTKGFEPSAAFGGLLLGMISLVSFAWYVHAHGVTADQQSTPEVSPGTGPKVDH